MIDGVPLSGGRGSGPSGAGAGARKAGGPGGPTAPLSPEAPGQSQTDARCGTPRLVVSQTYFALDVCFVIDATLTMRLYAALSTLLVSHMPIFR